MKQVLQTTSLSWAHSVHLALEGAGIEAVLLDEAGRGVVGGVGAFRVAVVNDDDIAAAGRVIKELGPPSGSTSSPGFRWLRFTGRSFAGAFVLGFSGGVLSEAVPLLATVLWLGALGAALAGVWGVFRVWRAEGESETPAA